MYMSVNCKRSQWLLGLVLVTLVALTGNNANADSFTVEISGKISNFTDPQRKVYDLTEKDIPVIKQATIRTSTNWTKAETFTGFSARDLLAKVGATGKFLDISCLDDYEYTIPVSDISKYDLVFAYMRNGVRMGIDNLGPLALIYPRDQHPKELGGPDVDAKFIWQISKIVVK